MKRMAFGALMSAVAMVGGGLSAGPAGAVDAAATPAIAAAIADPGRPQADRDLDAARKPAQTLAFIGLEPGWKVVDVFPGPYFGRLFADVVGPRGKVFMFIPTEVVKIKEAPALANGSKPFPDHPNVVALTAPIDAFSVPESVNMIWIRQNYHDLHDKFMGPADVPAFNRAAFKALKPGGEFIVIDHAAPDGSGLADTDTTHRIDAAQVKKEVTAAGFIFAGESDILHNPADPRTAVVFDKSIRGHTDQFIFKFRKPG